MAISSSSTLSSCYLSAAAAAEPRSSCCALRGWSAINYPRRQVSSFNYYVKYNINNNNNRGLLLLSSSKFSNPDDRFYRLRMSSVSSDRINISMMQKSLGDSEIDSEVRPWIQKMFNNMMDYIFILDDFLFSNPVKVSRILASPITVLVFAIMAAALSPSFARTRAASIIHSNSSPRTTTSYILSSSVTCKFCNPSCRQNTTICDLCWLRCPSCDCYPLRPCIQCYCRSKNSISQFLHSCTCNCHIPCKCECHVDHFPFELLPHPIILALFFLTIHWSIKKSMNSKDLMEFERCGTLFFLQIAILDKNQNLQRKINNIAGSGHCWNTHTFIGLNYVLKGALKEVVKNLLQHQDSCHSAYRYARYDNMKSFSKPCFNFLQKFLQKSVLQRYDKNEKTFVNDLKCKKEFIGEVDNEYSVVTLIVLAWGECWIPNWHTPNPTKVDIKTTLQLIGSIPVNKLEVVKVLCTQQTENYERLMRPVSVS